MTFLNNTQYDIKKLSYLLSFAQAKLALLIGGLLGYPEECTVPLPAKKRKEIILSVKVG